MENLRSIPRTPHLMAAAFALHIAGCAKPPVQNSHSLPPLIPDGSSTSELLCTANDAPKEEGVPRCADLVPPTAGYVPAQEQGTPDDEGTTVTSSSSHFTPDFEAKVSSCFEKGSAYAIYQPKCLYSTPCKPNENDCRLFLDNVNTILEIFNTCAEVQADPKVLYTLKDQKDLADARSLTVNLGNRIIDMLNNPRNPEFTNCVDTGFKTTLTAKINLWKSQNP